MAKTLAQIKAKHEHTYQDEDGKTVTSQTFIKDFTFFEDIEYLYSKDCPDGIKIDSHHVALYCRFMSYQADGKTCYESQGTLARKRKTSVSTIGRRISDLKKLGLVTTEPNPDPKYDTLLYTALPLTDAHITPPDALTVQPVTVSDVVPYQPEPTPNLEPVNETSYWDDIPCAWDKPGYLEPPAPTPTPLIQQDTTELPWGGVAICKTNGDPTDAALKWALTETMGDEEEAYRLISRVVSDCTGKDHCFTPRTEDEFDPIPF